MVCIQGRDLCVLAVGCFCFYDAEVGLRWCATCRTGVVLATGARFSERLTFCRTLDVVAATA